jgi:hypothetical protein
MSVEAPERIWAEYDPDTGEKRWYSIKCVDDVEYVRSDKLEELAAALAEKDKEIATLREAIKGLLKYGCPVSFCMNDCATDNPGCPTRKAEALAARNAGGKNA